MPAGQSGGFGTRSYLATGTSSSTRHFIWGPQLGFGGLQGEARAARGKNP